jgi:hypothetical protein
MEAMRRDLQMPQILVEHIFSPITSGWNLFFLNVWHYGSAGLYYELEMKSNVSMRALIYMNEEVFNDDSFTALTVFTVDC